MAEHDVVVLGAGVVGLTTALVLSRLARYRITVVAKHMPGDYDIEYASPWAGANFLPLTVKGGDAPAWNQQTWRELERLARDVPEAGIHFQGGSNIADTILYHRLKDAGTASAGFFSLHDWFKDVIPNFRELPKSELPAGFDSATSFTSVCINVAIYLPWLVSQCLQNAVVMKRGEVQHICEAASLHHSGSRAGVIVNCTGLSSCQLGGVEDKSVVPTRGQIVLVRNDPGIMCSTSGADDGEDELTYIMQRAAGGGTIIGGSYQRGNWDAQPDPDLARRMLGRAAKLCPTLTGGKGIEAFDVVRHGVGLRPTRTEGIRIERENINGVNVVHNYGHGGYGYQSSYGCAVAAAKLVDQALAAETTS